MDTVEHLIICPMYAKPRNEVLGHHNIIKDGEPRKVLKFVKKINRDTPLLSNILRGDLSMGHLGV